MYLSRKGKHKNIAYEQNLQVASFTGNLRNQCKNNCFTEADKESTFEYFLFSNYKSNKT
jgi:hypothetical protein